MLSDGFHGVPPGKVAMVVTHLEMRAPQLRGARLPQGLEFKRLPNDVDTYRALFRRIGQDWLWFGRLLLEDDALADILNDQGVELFTLTKDGQPEAILELDFRTFPRNRDCELAYFGLSNALIGTGAGAYLMDRAVECAFGMNVDRLHVHTCTLDSPQALSFYIRSGFVPLRQEVEIADDPRLIGVLPKTAGAHIPIIQPSKCAEKSSSTAE